MTEITVRLEAAEATHLSTLTEQLLALLQEADGPDAVAADPGLRRLVPNAYPDDEEAAAEFRRLTESDLLDRRRDDAQLMHDSLERATADVLLLSESEAAAWLRTLTALRLVLAERLGIRTDEDPLPTDPGVPLYNWLGYRLEMLVRAVDER